MALSVNGQIRDDTNWLMVVSDELRAWWEVINPPPARDPDPWYRVPPPLMSLRPGYPGYDQYGQPLSQYGNGTSSIDTRTMLLIGAVVVAVLVLNK